MSWLDNFAYLNGAVKAGFVGSMPTYKPPTFHAPQGTGYEPWATSRPGSTLWGAMAGGTLGKAPSYKAPTMPERFNFGVPSSTTVPAEATPPQSTKGDLFASFGAAVGDTAAHLNLANVIPWFMERVNVASGALADSHIPLASEAAGGVHAVTGTFLDAVQHASDVIAPVMDALPNWYRDTQLADRVKLYRGVVTGTEPDFGIFGASGNIIPFSSSGVREQADQYRLYRSVLAHSIEDPDMRRKAEIAIKVLRDSIDLPDSVKYAIEQNPDGDLGKLLDAAPEGRQFSYQPGVTGIISNAGYPLLFYLAEYGAARGALGGVARGVGAAVPGAVPVVAAAQRATTIAAKLQLAMTGAGVGYQGVSTVMDGIARYQGDQAAIDWFDRVNRTTQFSDDPRVQLVTSFSVNPFAAVGLAKKGFVRLASGTGDVTIGRVLGTRFTRYYTHSTLLAEQIKRMYRLGSVQEAEQFIATHYDTKGEAFDEVVGVALDDVLDKLPHEERLAFNAAHPDPVERTRAALRQYGAQTMNALERSPDEIAARWNKHSWEYHQYPGDFNAEVAALNARDYRHAAARTFQLRSRLDAVVGYTEFVPPRGQTIIGGWIDRVATEGRVKVEGVDGVQDLIRQFPAMRKYQQGLIPPGAKSVPRENVEEMLRRAEVDYATTVKQNPIRATTGADPVLRPDSPTLDRDYADALGTNIETVRAVRDFKPGAPEPTAVEAMRAFIAGKLNMDPELAASMTPEQVFERTSQYVTDATAPWVETGTRVVAAEKRLGAVKAELARLARIGEANRSSAHYDTTIRLEREMADIVRLIRTASDPITPFSQAVRFRGAMERRISRIRAMDPAKLSADDEAYLRRFLTDDLGIASMNLKGAALYERALDAIPTVDAGKVATARDAQLAEMAERKVDAIGVLRNLDDIDGQAESMITSVSGVPWTELLRKTPEGGWGWSGGTMPTTRAMRTRLADYLRNQGTRGRAIAAGINEIGDAEVWDLLSQHPGAMERMTTAQRRYIMAARGSNPAKTGMDEYADAWMRDNERSSGDWLEELSRLRDARDEALGGRQPHNLARTADLRVPPLYVAEAEAAAQGRTLYYDAEFDAVIHPDNIARVADILAQPQGLYTVLRETVNGDPILRGQVDEIAAATGIPATELLRDPVHAPKLKALIPADFEPPVPGLVQEATELDFLIRSGDAPAVARLSAQMSDQVHAPTPPLALVPEREAQRVSAGASTAGRPVLARDPRIRIAEATDADTGWVHFTTRANARGVLAEGFRTADREPVLGGHAGYPPGTVFLGKRGYPFMESMGSEFRVAHPNEEMVTLRVDLAPNAKVFDAPMNITRHALVKEGMAPAAADEIIAAAKSAQSAFPEKAALAQWAQRNGYDAVVFGDEEMALLPSRVAPEPIRYSLRASTRYRQELIAAGSDMSAAPDAGVLEAAENALGVDVLSVLNHGITGTKPATVRGVIELLREIENGNAGRLGIGPGLQAEGQRVALALLRTARNDARREGIPAGVYGKGLNPAIMDEEDLQLARTLEETIDPRTGRPKKGGVPAVTYDPADPLGTLQYGLKRRPKDAVVLEWAQVPGLSEEFLAGHFQPWQERVWTAQVRHAYNWVFGPRSNAAVKAAVRERFIERAGKQGVDQPTAGAIWDEWARISHDSRDTEVRLVPREGATSAGAAGPVVGEAGFPIRPVREHVPADNPLYADVRNIPTKLLDKHAQEAIYALYSGPNAITARYLTHLRSIDYGTLFREASSFTRRTLVDAPIPLGDELARLYGGVAHNKFVTTAYYWFRFALDLRYHAMNYFESQILYTGRAGLRKGEIDSGLLGQTEAYLRKLDLDPSNNTGYTTSRSRMAWAYRTFLKEQPEALRSELRGLATDDPNLMEQAIREIAANDEELSATIKLMGDAPDTYLAAMDRWYSRMMKSVDQAGADATIDEALAAEAAKTPHMAEVYGQLAQVNKDLWANVRATFYGNAERSRAERFLNSYLLFWPLSYQIKASKWLVRVLFDRAGGLPTNAGGAYVLDHMIASHNKLLATDPEYRDWYEKHKTLTFVAQMLMPVTWDSMGVSLNPALRSMFFDRTKSGFEIGPIYTFNKVLKPLAGELYTDLYPTLKDVPGFDGLYRGITGRETPKVPVDQLGG